MSIIRWTRRAVDAGLLVALAVALAAACALPGDEEAQTINDPELRQLISPSTTTSTTVVGATEDRQLYFFDEEQLRPESRALPSDASLPQILDELSVGSTLRGRTTAVPTGLSIASTELDDGTLTIILADDALFELQGADITRAVAQIVVTATQLDDFDIEQVRFEGGDGSIENVPAGLEETDTREPVDECDYQQYFTSVCPAEPTTTTTTARSTTTSATAG